MSEHAAHDKTDNERSAIYRGASSDALCQERHDGLAEAIQTGDVERFLSYYSKDIDFHDWTHNAHLVGLTALREFFQDIFAKLSPIELHDMQLSASDPSLAVWEFEKRFTVLCAMPHLGREKGMRVRKRAALVQHWRVEKDEETGKNVWKIWKERDYGQRDQVWDCD